MLTTDFRNHERGSSRRAERRSRRRAKTFIAGATTAALTISGGILLATPASADSGYSESAAQYLSGSLLGDSLANIANLKGASAAAQYDDRETTVEASSLDLSVLGGSVLLNTANGLQVPLTVTNAGVVGQYAQADSDGSSTASTGLVGSDGILGVGPDPKNPPGPLSLDLTNALGPGLTSNITDFNVQVGASTATATQSAPGYPAGRYNIADAEIRFKSDAVARLQNEIRNSIAPLQDAVKDVRGQGGTVIQDLKNTIGGVGVVTKSNITLDVDLETAADKAFERNQVLGENGPVEINLSTDVVTVDFKSLLASDGQNLNSLPEGTELLTSETVSLIQNQINVLMNNLMAEVDEAVSVALDNAVLNVDVSIENPANVGVPAVQLALKGTLIDISTGVAKPTVVAGDESLLNAAMSNTASRLVSLQVPTADILSGTTDSLTPTLNEVASSVLSLKVNVQNTTDGVFTETALRLSLLGTDDGSQTPLQLNLARASVGPNALGPNPNNPVTVVSDFTPTSGPEAGNTEVTINGFGFTGTNNVLFGATPATKVEVISDNIILATSPAGTGAVMLTVSGSPSGDAVSATPFIYVPEEVTGVTGFSPTNGPEAGGTIVTIVGGGFTGATGVNFGLTPATDVTVISDSVIRASSPAGKNAVKITVVGTGTGDLTSGRMFSYVADSVVDVSGFTPKSGPETGGTVVSIQGKGLSNVTGVKFGSTSAAVTVVSDNEITATAPSGTGIVTLSVLGTSNGDVQAPGLFTYIPASVPVPAAVTSISPNTGPDSGGTAVTIEGTGFTGATGVNFGSNPATSFAVVSDTRVTAIAPSGTGKVPVTVLGTATGDLVSTELFIYNPDNGNGGTPNPGNGGTPNPGNGGTPNPGNGGTPNPGNGGTPNPDNGNGGLVNNTGDGEVYYENCAAAQAAGVGPLNISDAGYRPALDKDGDGIACEENTAVARTGSDNPFPLWFGLAGIVLVGAGVFFVTRKATPKTK